MSGSLVGECGRDGAIDALVMRLGDLVILEAFIYLDRLGVVTKMLGGCDREGSE
jgi:hypothetical protein